MTKLILEARSYQSSSFHWVSLGEKRFYTYRSLRVLQFEVLAKSEVVETMRLGRLL